MIITKTINADLWIRERPQEIHAVQGDTATRRIVVKLFANREPWLPPEEASFAVRYRKPDGTGGTYDTMPNGEKAWERTENAVSFLLAPQMLAVPGRVEVQAELFTGGCVLASFLFYILVEENVAAVAVKSRNYFNWVQRLEEKLKEKLKEAKDSGVFDGPVGATPKLQIGNVTTLAAGNEATASIGGTPENPVLDLGLPKGKDAVIDATLSLSGRAADAAAVGSALALKAPSGYGLGIAEELPDGTDLNTVTQNGWYYWDGQVENAPPSYINIMRAWTHLGGSCMQEGIALSNDTYWGTMVRRMVYGSGSATTPWEYVNPPMVLGEEYRTTERWQGKPVYAKLIHCGYLPNASSKEIAHNIPNCSPLSYYGTWANGTQAANSDPSFSVIFSYSKVVVITKTDLSGSPLLLALKYTKD